MILVIGVIVLSPASLLLSQGYFEMTSDIASAYQSVSRLRLDEARSQIAAIKKASPDNLLVYHVENYIDFFTLFISEDNRLYDELKANKDRRLEKISAGDSSSPYYLFCIAEVNLQWATARLKFGERLKPLREVYKAYKLLKQNQKAFPSFIENKKSLSIIHALGESLPGLVRTIFNVDGSIAQGTQEIADLVAYSDQHPEFIFREECYAIYAYILYYQNNERQKAYEVLQGADLDIAASPLLTFLMANIAQKTGHNDEAIALLEQRPTGDEYLPFYYLDFMYGKFLMYKLDPAALDHMEVFITNFDGRHFIKEAYQKIAWYALAAEEDIVKYKKYMALCTAEGYELVDEDKQALREAQTKHVPNAVLLQARLLYDGGYYRAAYNKLVLKAHLFVGGDQEIEFNYRMGRIMQALANPSDAITYYLATIDEGEDEGSYFACNSALQIGLILENQKEYKKAEQLFRRCLNIDSEEYRASIHQKAKSGIERVQEAMKGT